MKSGANRRLVCGHCRRTGATLRCTQCKRTHYCNADCQAADWNKGSHRDACIGTLDDEEMENRFLGTFITLQSEPDTGSITIPWQVASAGLDLVKSMSRQADTMRTSMVIEVECDAYSLFMIGKRLYDNKPFFFTSLEVEECTDLYRAVDYLYYADAVADFYTWAVSLSDSIIADYQAQYVGIRQFRESFSIDSETRKRFISIVPLLPVWGDKADQFTMVLKAAVIVGDDGIVQSLLNIKPALWSDPENAVLKTALITRSTAVVEMLLADDAIDPASDNFKALLQVGPSQYNDIFSTVLRSRHFVDPENLTKLVKAANKGKGQQIFVFQRIAGVKGLLERMVKSEEGLRTAFSVYGFLTFFEDEDLESVMDILLPDDIAKVETMLKTNDIPEGNKCQLMYLAILSNRSDVIKLLQEMPMTQKDERAMIFYFTNAIRNKNTERVKRLFDYIPLSLTTDGERFSNFILALKTENREIIELLLENYKGLAEIVNRGWRRGSEYGDYITAVDNLKEKNRRDILDLLKTHGVDTEPSSLF